MQAPACCCIGLSLLRTQELLLFTCSVWQRDNAPYHLVSFARSTPRRTSIFIEASNLRWLIPSPRRCFFLVYRSCPYQSCSKPTFDFLSVYSCLTSLVVIHFGKSPFTVIPMLRAVPATIRIADSTVKKPKFIIFFGNGLYLFPGNFNLYGWSSAEPPEPCGFNN